MTAEHLVATLLDRGATIRLDDRTGELVIRPASVVTPELLDALRSRKPEVVEVVRRMQARERARGG